MEGSALSEVLPAWLNEGVKGEKRGAVSEAARRLLGDPRDDNVYIGRARRAGVLTREPNVFNTPGNSARALQLFSWSLSLNELVPGRHRSSA